MSCVAFHLRFAVYYLNEKLKTSKGENVDFLLRNINKEEWKTFKKLCIDKGTSCSQQLRDMIKEYNKKEGE